jgi:hypothetical protein
MDEKPTAAQPPHGCFFCSVAGPQIEAMLGHLWPEETHKHFRAARVEVLKGIRSLLDARIERLSKQTPTGTKITVE